MGASWLRRPSRHILSKCFKFLINPLQNGAFWSLGRLMAQEADPPDPFQMSQILYKSFTKRSILEPQAPHGFGGRSARSSQSVSNPLEILYKTEHSGASGASWLRRPIRQILSKCFKSFINPLQNPAFWSFVRLMAQEADPPDPFQMLQFLYKFFTKRSILEPRAPHGSGARSARSLPNVSNPLQILCKTEHSGASGAS